MCVCVYVCMHVCMHAYIHARRGLWHYKYRTTNQQPQKVGQHRPTCFMN